MRMAPWIHGESKWRKRTPRSSLTWIFGIVLAEAQLHSQDRRGERQRDRIPDDDRRLVAQDSVGEPQRHARGEGGKRVQREVARAAGAPDLGDLRHERDGGEEAGGEAGGGGDVHGSRLPERAHDRKIAVKQRASRRVPTRSAAMERRIMDFDTKDLLEAIGPNATLIFAAWIFLSVLQTRYNAAYEQYRGLINTFRNGDAQGERRESLISQIVLYKRRCEQMRFA